MGATYCTWLIEKPCLSQSEWAAWIQVTGALIALFLSIYVPLRMRRLDELERRESATGCIKILKDLADHYVKILPDTEQPLGSPPPELAAGIAACRAHLTSPSTPVAMLPLLSQATNSGERMLTQWQTAFSNKENRTVQQFVETAIGVKDQIEAQLRNARSMTTRWCVDHWFTLLWT